MIRGVSFEVPQATTDTLWRIFKTVDIAKYFWRKISSQTEVWDEPFGIDFFDQDYYNGKDFMQCIQSDHYIVFLKLEAYYHADEFDWIHTYKDFVDSDCQLILLVNDCEYVEIYSKDQKIINIIFQNAVKNCYKNIEYITDCNDGRSKMDIL